MTCRGALACAAILFVLTFGISRVHAVASPDQPAAIVVFPLVTVEPSTGTDTVVQLANTSPEPIEVRCFYEDRTFDCVGGGAGESCYPQTPPCSGQCVARRERIPFRVRLTPFQPVAWSVASGRAEFPLDGVERVGVGGATNAFSAVPGVGNVPFNGVLRCVSVDIGAYDGPYAAAETNSLIGLATIERRGTAVEDEADAAQYRAVGIRALEGEQNLDEHLVIGGPDAEYEACPAFLFLEHFFDGAPLRDGENPSTVDTTIALTPCGSGIEGDDGATLQFLVFNEFAQRFSTSRNLSNGQFVSPLANIDTVDSTRSIFSVGISGAPAGHTVIRSIGRGLYAVAIERQRRTATFHSDAYAAHTLGARAESDVLTYRAARCAGDCSLDGRVTIEELVTGVGMALGSVELAGCLPVDFNSNQAITVDELVRSVASALDGCPASSPTPTPTTMPTTTPPPTPGSVGPEITHFGLATADDIPLEPDATDDEGRPVYVRPFGQGMVIVLEARPGTSARPIDATAYSATGELPGFQLLISNPLGDGGVDVCEMDGRRGGIPGTPSLDFAASDVAAAINDLGCRAYDRQPTANRACTRSPRSESSGQPFGPVSPLSTGQLCVPVARAWAFPAGDTIVAGRVRDVAGNYSDVREIVVRVEMP